MHFTYTLNIDIDITIFCKYYINIILKLKKRYQSISILWHAVNINQSY